MDAFYAAIEQRDNPSLRGRAVAIGHAGGRGVVATASYEARRYGVHSAQSSATAQRRCPSLIFVSPRFDVYKQVSAQIREIFYDYTDLVEPLSLDEAFLDVTVNKKGMPSATLIAKEIKQRIKETTDLTASAGVSINKFLAKIASDYDKPDGLFVIKPSEAYDFVAGLEIERFFGIGKVTADKMHSLGIKTGADLRKLSLTELVSMFGKQGFIYYNNARGIDNRPVVADRIRKSVGAENTFEEDIASLSELKNELATIREELWRRITKNGFHGKTITLKVKYSDFRQITRSRTIDTSDINPQLLQQVSEQLLENIDLSDNPVRLLGLSVSNAGMMHSLDPMQQRIPFKDWVW